MADGDDRGTEHSDDHGENRATRVPDRYDLGVLFVHGIGQQARGQTLTAWADPVIRWLQAWLGRKSVEVGAAELAPLPDDPAAPAHLELRVTSPSRAGDGRTEGRWLLAEAWWAEAFGLPRFRELAIWGFAVLPWTVVAHFATRLQQASHRSRTPGQAPRASRLRTLAGDPAHIARVAWQSLGLLIAVMLFPLLAVGVLAVVVLGAVPIPQVRQVAVALQRVLSTSVGDSFVLLSSPTREHAIVTRVERDLRWLAHRCQRVAVVAHSQGAAIAHRALRGIPPDRRKLAKFVTVGSGQTKLVDLERLRDTDTAQEVWLAPAGLLVLATSIWLIIDGLRPGGAEETDADWFAPLWVAFMGLVLLLFGIRAAWPQQPPNANEVDVSAERGWLDVYASHDPVANGPLFHQSSMPDGMLPITSQQVHNLASPLRDHTSYWHNTDEFVSTIAATIADAAGQSVDDPGRWDASARQAAASRRRWRVGWLQGLRLLALATAGVLLLVHADRSDAIGGRAVGVATRLADLLPLFDWNSGARMPLQARQGIGILTIVLATLAGYLLLAGLWRWWDVRESRRQLRRDDLQLWSTEFLGLLTGTGTLLVAAWLVSAGAKFTLAALIGLPVIPVALLLVWGLFVPPLMGLVRLLQRLGYARDVDPERPMVPVLLLTSTGWFIVLLLGSSQVRTGLAVAMLIGSLSLPVIATLLPPILAASPRMRTLAWRLRAWAHAEPAPLAHARLLGAEDGDRLLVGYSKQLTEALKAHPAEGAEEAHQREEGGDVAPIMARMLRQAAHQREKERDIALVVARTLQQRNDTDSARRLLQAAAPTSIDAAIALMDLEPESPSAHGALSRHCMTAPWRDRRRARRALATHGVTEPSGQPTR